MDAIWGLESQEVKDLNRFSIRDLEWWSDWFLWKAPPKAASVTEKRSWRLFVDFWQLSFWKCRENYILNTTTTLLVKGPKESLCFTNLDQFQDIEKWKWYRTLSLLVQVITPCTWWRSPAHDQITQNTRMSLALSQIPQSIFMRLPSQSTLGFLVKAYQNRNWSWSQLLMMYHSFLIHNAKHVSSRLLTFHLAVIFDLWVQSQGSFTTDGSFNWESCKTIDQTPLQTQDLLNVPKKYDP